MFLIADKKKINDWTIRNWMGYTINVYIRWNAASFTKCGNFRINEHIIIKWPLIMQNKWHNKWTRWGAKTSRTYYPKLIQYENDVVVFVCTGGRWCFNGLHSAMQNKTKQYFGQAMCWLRKHHHFWDENWSLFSVLAHWLNSIFHLCDEISP